MGGEADHGAVDVDADRAVGGATRARQQVGASRRQVEDDVLIDLALVETLVDRLLGPLAELRVPQRAIGVRVPWILEGWEVTEDVQQIAAVSQGVDQRSVAG